MSLTYTDIFCGAGGSSIGLSGAGLELQLAANHWDRAIETHSANFPDAEHLCADVNNYDMRRLPRTDVLWASPICTEVSPAGGRKRRQRAEPNLFDHGPVAQAGFDRTRATFHDVIRATEVHRYLAVIVENVVEVVDQWELFDWWVQGMCQLRPGYNVQFVSVSSAHVGDDTNPHAPQWRDRLYLVFTQAKLPLPDVAPRPLAWCVDCDELVHAVQTWKNHRKRKVGKYRQQYVYRCPNTRCRHALVEPYVLPAAAAIDWSDLGQRIGDRKRPLAAKTLARIEAGLRQFARPITTGTNHGLVHPPFVTELRGGGSVVRPVDEPLATVTAGDGTTGGHHALTVPPGAFIAKYFTPRNRDGQMAKDVRTEPLGAVTAVDHHSLVVPYYRTGKAKPTSVPLDAVTSRDRFALVGIAELVEDCLFRMLQPREHLRAQRFPDSYVVHGNKGEQTMQAGSAVSANVAQWLGERLAAVLGAAA